MSKGTEYLRQIIGQKSQSEGIPSLCSSNEYVIKAALEYAKDNGQFVLIEATANQVNQYGGYTGMRPLDFKNYVMGLADGIGLDKEKIILGGDHLGPVVFKHQNEMHAMVEAETLIREFVHAGFEKIHIDTSMRLADDPIDQPLSDAIIARRGARLCKAAEQAYQEAFGRPSELVYIIGSEVPIPGGAQSDHEAQIQVTTPIDFEATVNAFKRAFKQENIFDAFNRVIAVVVQPGVEFGDESVDEYDSQKARALIDKLKKYDNIAFEGHSTDYQTQTALSKMVRDGIRILKVGPELTFALREGLFALQYIDNELKGQTDFINTLDRVMLEYPEYWHSYYTGTEEEITLKRKFSYSDRWRYYAGHIAIQQKMQELFDSLNEKGIPVTLLHQFLPNQTENIKEKKLVLDSEALIKDKIKEIITKYYAASKQGKV